MRTLLPVSARPPRIHRASDNKGGKNEVTKCNLGGDWPQLHLPGLLVLELRQIGAKRAGADAAREVLGQLRIIAPDALDAGADVFRYQRARPLDVRGASTHAAMPPDRRGELLAERLELALRALLGAGIIVSLGLGEFRAYFRQPAPIRRYGLGVECFTSVTQIGSSYQALSLRVPDRSGRIVKRATLDDRNQVACVDADTGMREQIGNVFQALEVAQAEGSPTVRDGPKVTVFAENIFCR